MRTPYFSLLLISICLFPLFNTSEANQAKQLKSLIKSRRSSKSSIEKDRPWNLEEESANTFVRDLSSYPQVGLREADKITELPGQPNGVNFNQYAGYVTVDPMNGRALFYYFAESHKPSNKPLVLWLNGGPGCSSLGYGAFEEVGPFRVNSDRKTLHKNYQAWNKVANVLFLESPAGVGFSYSNTTTDYSQSGDKKTADDSYNFLLNWLERFPEYMTRDFYITGESYAGHYIPELAYTILQRNKIANRTVINLRGVAIGNAFLDDAGNNMGTIDYLWTHALISDDTYEAVQKSCNFSSDSFSVTCSDAMDQVDNEAGNIDAYNIYAPICHDPNSTVARSDNGMARFDPCSTYYVMDYLNSPMVQKALHANVTSLKQPWEPCSGISWNDEPSTMLPTVQHLISSNLRVWLYSGDIDSVCPITGTRSFIQMLGLPVKNSWRPWSVHNEVGGYVEEYNGLTLVTVRGAGHEVPSYQPKRALVMINSFLQGKLPPP